MKQHSILAANTSIHVYISRTLGIAWTGAQFTNIAIIAWSGITRRRHRIESSFDFLKSSQEFEQAKQKQRLNNIPE